MSEPTVTCPQCQTVIKLTESLAAPLLESTRKQFQLQLAQKDSDILKREQSLQEKERQLLTSKNQLEKQVSNLQAINNNRYAAFERLFNLLIEHPNFSEQQNELFSLKSML